MLHRFFIWRAQKRMARSLYRLDKRSYRGIFKPGFFAHLSRTHFWQADRDPLALARKRRRRWLLLLALLSAVGFAWLLFESSRALKLF